MRIWVGIELIGGPRGAGEKKVVPAGQKIVQGVIYTVTGITDTHLNLQMRPEYCHGATDEKASIKLEQVCELLRLTHAICYYTAQGRTERDRHIVLLDMDHRHMSMRALIVGMSRATHGSYVHIGDEASEATFAGPRFIRQRRT